MSRKASNKNQHRSGPGRKGKGKGKGKGKAKGRASRVSLIQARPDMLRVRRSRLHGSGVFALRRIRKGTRIIEYLGDRVSHDEADLPLRATRTVEDNHTFLFIVDRSTWSSMAVPTATMRATSITPAIRTANR
jgi:hypothetical protein